MTRHERSNRGIAAACGAVLTLRSTVERDALRRAAYLDVYARARGAIEHPIWDVDFVQETLQKVRARRTLVFAGDRSNPQVHTQGIRVTLPSNATWRQHDESWVVTTSAVDLGVQAGYFSRSSVEVGIPPVDRPIRIYLSLRLDHVADLLGPIASALRSRLKLGWALKVAAHPLAFSRADVAVVYVDSRDLHSALRILSKSGPTMRSLRPRTPLFARPVGRGMAIAEEPPNNDGGELSFGTWVVSHLLTATEGAPSTRDAATRFRSLIRSEERDPEELWRGPQLAGWAPSDA